MDVQVVGTLCTDDFSTDFRTELLKLKNKQPDAIMIPFSLDRALRRMGEIGFKAKVLSTSDVIEAIFRRGFRQMDAAGVYFNDWQAKAEFAQVFEAKYGEPPIMEPQNSYEAIRAIARGFELNPANLLEGLKRVKYQGVAGLVDFTRSHAGNYAQGKLYRVEKEGFTAVQ